MFGVYDTNDVAVGVCGLTSISPLNQTGEFSLYIDPFHRRKGYAKAALLALLDIGYMQMNLNRIWGETFSFNPASRLFESIGMKNEGTLRASYFKEGQFVDSIIYAMLRDEYVSRYRFSSRIAYNQYRYPSDIDPSAC